MQISAPHDFPASLVIIIHIPQAAHALLPLFSHVPYIVHMVLIRNNHIKVLNAYGFLHVKKITAYLVIVAVLCKGGGVAFNGIPVNVFRCNLCLVKGQLFIIRLHALAVLPRDDTAQGNHQDCRHCHKPHKEFQLQLSLFPVLYSARFPAPVSHIAIPPKPEPNPASDARPPPRTAPCCPVQTGCSHRRLPASPVQRQDHPHSKGARQSIPWSSY